MRKFTEESVNYTKTLNNTIYNIFTKSVRENMEVTEQVLDTMKKEKKALSAGQIAELAGIDRKEVDKAMKKLKTEGKIVSPKNCYWEPASK